MNYTLWPHMPTISENLIAQIRGLDPSKVWDVTIAEHKKAKTPSQRGWWHKLLEIWGDEIGLTQGQCKELVKGYHLGWKVVTVAGVEFRAADGSSEALDRIGYSALIETTYRLAAEMGVILPDANRFRRAV